MFHDEKDYEVAVRLASAAKRLSPASTSATKQKATALAYLANNKSFDKPQDALQNYREVLSEFDILRRRDPANRLWEREQAAVQLLIAGGLVACHQNKAKDCKSKSSLEEAEVTNLKAILTLSVLAEIDPSDMSLQRDLAWARQGRAKVLEARGQHTERLAALKESERLYRASIRDFSDAEVLSEIGSIVLDQSKALADLDRWAEAKATLQRSINSFENADKKDGAKEGNLAIVGHLIEARTEEVKLLRKTGDKKGADLADQERKRLEEQSDTLYPNLFKDSEEATKLYESHTASVGQGDKLLEEGKHAAALGEFNAAESAMREYINLKPTDYSGYDNLREVYNLIQQTQEKLGYVKEMAAAGSVMLDMARIATLLMPEEDAQERGDTLREAQQSFGILLYRGDHFKDHIDETLAVVQQEVAAAEANLQKSPNNADHLSKVSNAYYGQGLVRREAHKVGWEEAIRIGIVSIQMAADIDRKNPVYQNKLGEMRKYLADGLVAKGLKEEAQVEYGLALKAYQHAAKISPGDETALKGIRELAELGVR